MFLQLADDTSMYGMGVKYDIHGLKGLASEESTATLRQHQSHAESTTSKHWTLKLAIKGVYNSELDLRQRFTGPGP